MEFENFIMQNNYQLVFLLRFRIDQVMNDVHQLLFYFHISNTWAISHGKDLGQLTNNTENTSTLIKIVWPFD
jgi:hypothetical protein